MPSRDKSDCLRSARFRSLDASRVRRAVHSSTSPTNSHPAGAASCARAAGEQGDDDGPAGERERALPEEAVDQRQQPRRVRDALEQAAHQVVVPHELGKLEDYVSEAIALEDELCRNLKSLNSAEFEEVLRPVFREDESTLIAVGAALGGVAGLLQFLLMTLL